jgi:hypothetical protein
MKAVLFATLVAFAGVAQAQTREAAAVPSCGPSETKFQVNTNKNDHRLAQPDGGKALVYVIEDDTRFFTVPKPTIRLGIDGSWQGATHGNSYFYFSVEPGEHHLCASWQSNPLYLGTHRVSAAHLSAQAGGVYYFRVRDIYRRDAQDPPTMDIEPLDSDEGQLLAGRFSLSTAKQKP